VFLTKIIKKAQLAPFSFHLYSLCFMLYAYFLYEIIKKAQLAPF
jgi:hypothetical protein